MQTLFGVFNSSKKQTKNESFQVRFLEELKTPKCSFEINWPLGLQELKLAFKNKRIPWCESVEIVLTPDEVFSISVGCEPFTKKK